MKSDIEIAGSANIQNIFEIAEKTGLQKDEIIPWGNYKAKISFAAIDRIKDNKNGKLILVTTINPTPVGEGKTTVTIGLAQALAKLGKKTMLGIREPSLGPIMGIKGGATGGGYSQVLPMEDINLHFTGDMHAITSAHNLLASLLDNHIHHGDIFHIDPLPFLFRALILTTITTASGFKLPVLQTMSKNFSAPSSEPKPASVTK